MVSHILVIGETQSGKTFWANRFHQGSPGTVSVFFNTNHVPNVWGVKVHSLNELVAALQNNVTKLNYVPYRGMDDPERERAGAQLREVVGFFDKHWTHDSTRWARLVIDEAQWFERECQYAFTMFLGKHVQVVGVTQYPKMVDTTSRSNIPVWVVFRTGFQMHKFFQGFGQEFPAEDIKRFTATRFWFVTFDSERKWRAHRPL